MGIPGLPLFSLNTVIGPHLDIIISLHPFFRLFESFPSYSVGPFNSCLQLPYILVPFGLSGVPGLPNISSAGNPISLPIIIILGVYPVLLFTEDLNAPANCGKY